MRTTILEMEIATRQDEFIGRTEEVLQAVISGTTTEEKAQAMIDDPTSWGAESSDARVREAVLKATLELARFAIQEIISKSVASAAQTRQSTSQRPCKIA